jgi:hypothetical protein
MIKAIYEEEMFTMTISFDVQVVKGITTEDSIRELDIYQGSQPIEELCALISSVVKGHLRTDPFNLVPLNDTIDVLGTNVKVLSSVNKKILSKWATVPKWCIRKRKIIGQITAELDHKIPSSIISSITSPNVSPKNDLSSNLDDFIKDDVDSNKLDTLMYASEKILAENEIHSCNVRRAELMESYKAIKSEFERLGKKRSEAQKRFDEASNALK